MTQERLGELLEPAATRASIANVENGKQRVLAHTLTQIASALQVELTDLIKSPERKPVSKVSAVSIELGEKLALPSTRLRKLRRELGLLESRK